MMMMHVSVSRNRMLKRSIHYVETSTYSKYGEIIVGWKNIVITMGRSYDFHDGAKLSFFVKFRAGDSLSEIGKKKSFLT
ncbi:hypothetical protein CKC_03085 [Candidatus Liberibacter solanacearum CLso-ZC1]|uniref:Uncharacterized protein n=1 Tax=Liberibacter solanacearum (strain CLso-ZC1) TaxID=658172 RepID=E4UAX5_LIBSC|nr:hypothetical protein [Candidatus Liberibacter solanacearum]ADR52366.1 hypothetical protein CKC_03085 [Candidatus Liberibacter solanacearum CLso-ZC1]